MSLIPRTQRFEEPAISAVPAPCARPGLRRSLTAAGCAALLVTGLAACDPARQAPADERLANATEKLGERTSLSVAFDIEATPSQLVALSRAESADDPMPREMAEFLSGLRISLAVQTKKPIAEAGEKDVVGSRLTLSGPDGELAEYRLIGETAYYRADIQALGEATGSPVPSAEEAGALLPEGAEGLRKILEHKWIKIDVAELEKARQEAGLSSGPSPEPSLDSKTGKKMLDAVRDSLSRDVTVKDTGTRDGVTHLVATGSARALLTGVFAQLRPLAKDMPGSPELPTAKDLKEVPDEKLSVDFSVEGGELSGIRTDLAPLIDDVAKGQKLPLKLALGGAGRITAPAGATALDIRELMMAMGAAAAADSVSDEQYEVGADELEGDGFDQYEDPEDGDVSGLQVDADELYADLEG